MTGGQLPAVLVAHARPRRPAPARMRRQGGHWRPAPQGSGRLRCGAGLQAAARWASSSASWHACHWRRPASRTGLQWGLRRHASARHASLGPHTAAKPGSQGIGRSPFVPEPEHPGLRRPPGTVRHWHGGHGCPLQRHMSQARLPCQCEMVRPWATGRAGLLRSGAHADPLLQPMVPIDEPFPPTTRPGRLEHRHRCSTSMAWAVR